MSDYIVIYSTFRNNRLCFRAANAVLVYLEPKTLVCWLHNVVTLGGGSISAPPNLLAGFEGSPRFRGGERKSG